MKPTIKYNKLNPQIIFQPNECQKVPAVLQSDLLGKVHPNADTQLLKAPLSKQRSAGSMLQKSLKRLGAAPQRSTSEILPGSQHDAFE